LIHSFDSYMRQMASRLTINLCHVLSKYCILLSFANWIWSLEFCGQRAAPLLRKLVRECSTADLHSDSMTSKCVENINSTSKCMVLSHSGSKPKQQRTKARCKHFFHLSTFSRYPHKVLHIILSFNTQIKLRFKHGKLY
jgi:hypothetical protein